MIIPFFGDQPFWGRMVAASGAGPKPIDHKALDAEGLAHVISFCLTPQAAAGAKELAKKMRSESGPRWHRFTQIFFSNTSNAHT